MKTVPSRRSNFNTLSPPARRPPGEAEWRRADFFRKKAVFASKSGDRRAAMRAFGQAAKWRRAALEEGYLPKNTEGKVRLAKELADLDSLSTALVEAIDRGDPEGAESARAGLQVIGRRRAKRESWRLWSSEGVDRSWESILNGEN